MLDKVPQKPDFLLWVGSNYNIAQFAAANSLGNSRSMSQKKTVSEPQRPLLHLVFGGELKVLDGTEFRDSANLDIVGIYPSYAAAHAAWKGAAQRTVDNALMRYFIVHLHRLLEPQNDGAPREIETQT